MTTSDGLAKQRRPAYQRQKVAQPLHYGDDAGSGVVSAIINRSSDASRRIVGARALNTAILVDDGVAAGESAGNASAASTSSASDKLTPASCWNDP